MINIETSNSETTKCPVNLGRRSPTGTTLSMFIVRKSFKFLGINISNDLKREHHVNYIMNKMTPYCLPFDKTLSVKDLKSIYFA